MHLEIERRHSRSRVQICRKISLIRHKGVIRTRQLVKKNSMFQGIEEEDRRKPLRNQKTVTTTSADEGEWHSSSSSEIIRKFSFRLWCFF